MKPNVYHQVENSTYSLFSTYYYTDRSQYADKLHFHKNYEIINVIKGYCTVNYKNTDITLNIGEAIFIEPFASHGISLSTGAEVRSTVFQKNLIYSLSNYIENYRAPNPVFHPNATVSDYYNTELARCFGYDESVNDQLPADKTVIVKGCLYAMGGEFMRLVELVPTEKYSENVIQEVIDRISKNYLSDISLKELAHELGYSYHYVSRLFNNTMGISFKFLLNLYRSEHAAALLEDTDMPIGEIAFKSGFQNIKSFNTNCKLIYGKTPREIRKKAGSIM